jgi:beta-aspartyl-peptidase (threonine type)
MVGCGGYANKTGAATVTGFGESIMKVTLAREIVFNMEREQHAQVKCTTSRTFSSPTLCSRRIGALTLTTLSSIQLILNNLIGRVDIVNFE